MTPEMIDKIGEHYRHAKEKHPHFADRVILQSECTPLWAKRLQGVRHWLNCEIERGNISAETVLLCENAEMFAAIEQGKAAEAIEEAYDAIAVLLRIVDVLEGRQALGNPTDKETNNER